MINRFLVLIFVVTVFVSAIASPVSETVGAPGSVNPFSGRMFSGSAEATYFNPALLPSQKASVSSSLFFLSQNLSISLLGRPDGVDIPEDIYYAEAVGKNSELIYKPVPTEILYGSGENQRDKPRGAFSPSDSHLYASFGVVLHLIKKRLSLGIYSMMPVDTVQYQSSYFPDEREANFSNSLHFELYEDRMTSNNFSFALGGVVTDYLNIGVGANIYTKAIVNTNIYVKDATKNDTEIIPDSNIEVSTVPYFGLHFMPGKLVSQLKNLNITATLHPSVNNVVESVNDMKFWKLDQETAQKISLTELNIAHGFKPLTIALGASIQQIHKGPLRTDIGINLTYKKWSDYLNRQNTNPHVLPIWNSEIDNGEGEDKGNWEMVGFESRKWLDTISVVAGASFEYYKNRFGFDIAYDPTPVPDQRGRTNYIDSNKIAFGGGYSRGWSFGTTRFETGINLQFHYLFEREVDKDPNVTDAVVDEFPDSRDLVTEDFINSSKGLQSNNPGYPGFSSQGVLLLGGVFFTFFL